MSSETPKNLNARVILAKNDVKEMNSVIAEYTPFLRTLIKNTILKPKRYGEDDLFAAAQEAFWNALLSFNETKGNFILFARLVVKRKLLHIKLKLTERAAKMCIFPNYRCEAARGRRYLSI
jgi:RNA polymerase sigma factor